MSVTPLPLPTPLLDTTKFMEQITEVSKRLMTLSYDQFSSEMAYTATQARMSQFVSEQRIEYERQRLDRSVNRMITDYTVNALQVLPFGMEIIENDLLTIPAEDWSRVRSPGRARRRMRQGHRQNVRYYQAPDPKLLCTDKAIIGHPETIRKMIEKLGDRVRETQEQMIDDVLRGGGVVGPTSEYR